MDESELPNPQKNGHPFPHEPDGHSLILHPFDVEETLLVYYSTLPSELF